MTVRGIGLGLLGCAASYLAAGPEAKPGPATPFFWATMAERDGSAPAIGHALERGGALPSIWMRTANWHFVNGDPKSGLLALRSVLSATGEWDRPVFSTAVRLSPDIPSVLENAIGDRRSGEALLRFLLNEDRIEESGMAWGWLQRRGWAGAELGDLYMNRLIDDKLLEAAWEARGSKALLLDPGFEEPPGQRGFRWIAARAPVNRDSGNRHGGVSSLRVGGCVFQRTILRGAAYSLTGWIKGGPVHVQVFDEAHEGAGYSLNVGRSSDHWTRFRLPINKTGGVRLVQVRVEVVSGEAWLDDFALESGNG